MKVTIKKLHLRNFKGAKDVEINFSNLTNIEGDNGTGKTTVFDAFNFLLWGKNSANESSFGIKTFDHNNETIPELEHEVIGVLDVDGSQKELRRIYAEKWQTKRGSSIPVMTGHETKYFINNVPMSKVEYEKEVSSLFNPSIARMITDPLYFNTFLKWDQRRPVLQSMAGNISDIQIVMNSDLERLKDIITENPEQTDIEKLLSDKKRELTARKALVKKELDQIPSRMDEVSRNKPESLDFESLKKELNIINIDIDRINKLIDDSSHQQSLKFKEVEEYNKKKFILGQKIEKLEQELVHSKNKDRNNAIQLVEESKQELKTLKPLIEAIDTAISNGNASIDDQEKKKLELREKYNSVNAKKVISTDSILTECPTCSQSIPEDVLNQKRSEFIQKANEDRKKEMAQLVRSAEIINKEIDSEKEQIQILKDKKEGVLSKIKDAESKLNTPIPEIVESVSTPELSEMKKEYESMIEKNIEAIDNSELKKERSDKRDEAESIKDKLNIEKAIEKANSRLLELTDQQKTLSSELNLIDAFDAEIESFTIRKMEMVETRVNELFKAVKFKMFEKQINGGINQTCVCTLGGVPFSDLNTASKINAGLDVLYAIQKHHDAFAPVFIDNRESVSEILNPEQCQIINLIKVKGVSKLSVNNKNNI